MRHLDPGTKTVAQRVDTLPEVPRISDPHGIALASFNGVGEILSADRRFDHILNVANRNPAARRRIPVDANLHVGCAGDLLGIQIDGAWNVVQNALDFGGLALR